MKYLYDYLHSTHVQHFMNNSVLMNWSNLYKSILVLILGGIDHLLWIAWFTLCHTVPTLAPWLNPDYYQFHLTRMSLCCALFFLMIIPCHYFRHEAWAQHYLPYLSIILFSVSFIYGGYSIGITSPATIASYISLVTVGLVLFERKMVYLTFLPITLYLIVAIFLSMTGKMTYAPIFSDALNHSVLIRNEFWVYSQLYFYIPIFFAGLVLFEILLTQWRNREKQINEMSQIDPLTGIYNRRKIGQNLIQIQKDAVQFCLVLLDLDHFKKINDTYGHDVGDQVLKQVAKILSTHVRDQDIVGRFGGEEFIVVLKNKTLQQAMEIAERCRKAVESEPIYINKSTVIHVSASFGVSMSELHLSKEIIIRRADQALYMAKDAGRNQVRSFSG